MNKSGGRNHAVLNGHRSTCDPQVCEKLCPTQARGSVPREARELGNSLREPTLKAAATFPGGHEKYAEADLGQDNWINRQLRFVLAEPVEHLRRRHRLGCLTEYVG